MTTNTKHTPTPLDKVCIIQKYNVKCRRDFESAERDIIKSVNMHEELITALKEINIVLDNEPKLERVLIKYLGEERADNLIDDINAALAKDGE